MPKILGKILILGGTTEARLLAERLAARSDLVVTLSLAGRTAKPAVQPVPVRAAPEETGAVQPADVAPTQQLAATEPHFCSSCGAEHHPDEKFCPDCGKQITFGESELGANQTR